MIESGLIESWISSSSHLANSSKCDTKAKILSSHKRTLVQFTLEEMKHFFFIIFVGLSISVCGLLAEIIKAKVERNQDRNRQVKIPARNLPREPPPQQHSQVIKPSGPTQRPVLAKSSTRTRRPRSVLPKDVVAQYFLSRLLREVDEGPALDKSTEYLNE